MCTAEKLLYHNMTIYNMNVSLSCVMFFYSGLPHAHILLILRNKDKPQSPEIVDCLVCAEIPDIATNQKLFDVITRCNIHGPCGIINTNSPSMQGEGQSGAAPSPSQSHSPAEHSAAICPTQCIAANLPPRAGAHTRWGFAGDKNLELDNRWVVPYNPFLSLKYNAHINVDIVHCVSAVIYCNI